jgi:hypothetical protein
MLSLKNIGMICINGNLQGVCQSCLWLEWDRTQTTCLNQHTPVCSLPPDQFSTLPLWNRPYTKNPGFFWS